MQPNYRVRGIVQILIKGHWFERTTEMETYALDTKSAKESVLAWWTKTIEDAWIVRWYDPDRVAAYTIKEQ